jgi:CheY-like chemotaxis protein
MSRYGCVLNIRAHTIASVTMKGVASATNAPIAWEGSGRMLSRKERGRARRHDPSEEAIGESADIVVHNPILVVEDNQRLLEVLGILLDYEHYRAALTADGQDALDWLALSRPALVILDWRLPTIGGDRVVAGVRERYGRQVPILVLSAVADSEEARRAGADAYLRKPYSVPELVGTIRHLLAA